MKKGLIIINAYSKLPHSLNQAERLKFELNALGVLIDVKRNDFFACYLGDNGKLISKVNDYDFCIYLDKDKYVSLMLEKCGMRLFNCYSSIEACDDKMTTSILLSNNNVPMPKTLSGLLCYSETEKVAESTLCNIETELSYPLIAKASYGSLGQSVYKINNRAELAEISEKLKCKEHLFQEFVASSIGKDVRAIVIGGKFVVAMERKSDKDFRSNMELGGVGIPFTPDEKLISLCEKTSKILNLDYCGIDVLFGKNDNYLICEVNSNAFFGGIEAVTGYNVAKAYATYVFNTIYK